MSDPSEQPSDGEKREGERDQCAGAASRSGEEKATRPVTLLDVRDLEVVFTRKGRRDVTAVDGVSFTVASGETVGLVGESGSGKSVTSLAVMGLLPKRGVRVHGSVTFEGRQLLTMDDKQLRSIRGRDIAMVFQDPMSSLNPVVPIGRQVTEVLERHRDMSGADARKEAARLLNSVGIPDPDRRLREYPHQLSGGMRQRALIAMALACKPRLLIADEPTTALDVTIQAQILELLKELVADSGTALVMITHDLGVIAGSVRPRQRHVRGSCCRIHVPPRIVRASHVTRTPGPAGVDSSTRCATRREAACRSPGRPPTRFPGRAVVHFHRGVATGSRTACRRLRTSSSIAPTTGCAASTHSSAFPPPLARVPRLHDDRCIAAARGTRTRGALSHQERHLHRPSGRHRASRRRRRYDGAAWRDVRLGGGVGVWQVHSRTWAAAPRRADRGNDLLRRYCCARAGRARTCGGCAVGCR